MTKPETLVAEFAEKLRRKPEHTQLQAIYKVVVTGPGGGVWRMDFKNGGRVLPGDGAADLTFTLGAAELESLTKGTVKRTALDKQGKVKWEGKREHLNRLGALLRNP